MSNNLLSIHPHIIRIIRKQKPLKNELCSILNVSPATLQRWLSSNKSDLISKQSVQAICSHLNLTIGDITNINDFNKISKDKV
jgi:DNA-binding Xre family transcriptional regulator